MISVKKLLQRVDDLSSSSSTTLNEAFFYSILIVCGIAIAAHSFGLIAIYLYKKRTNQNIILACFSGAEIFSAIHRILNEILLRAFFKKDHLVTSIIAGSVLPAIFFIGMYLICSFMYILSLDRFVFILSPLKYRSRMTRRRTILIILILSVVSITIGIIQGVTNLKGPGLVLGGLYLVFSVVTYITIIRKSATSTLRAGRENNTFYKQFLVPIVLTLTVIVMYMMPLAVYSFTDTKGRLLSRTQFCLLPSYICLVIDAVTYILFMKQYRHTLRRLICGSPSRVFTRETMNQSTRRVFIV